MCSQILFIIPNFQHGGTNKSLESLLGLLESHKESVCIIAVNNSPGPYKKVYEKYDQVDMPWWARWYFKSGYLTMQLRRLDFFLFGNLIERFLFKLSVKCIERKKKFSVVIAFQEGDATRMGTYFSQYKIAWVHCCYSFIVDSSRRNRPFYSGRFYDRYDKIVCVSDFAAKDFCSCFPGLTKKTTRIYNSLNIDSITTKGKEECAIKGRDNVFTIVSVGRLSPDKRFQLIPKICRAILDRGNVSSFRWMIIGAGGCFDEIKREIQQHKVEDTVFLLGAKDNPYPYMKDASLLVVLSVSESWSYVLHEGLVLGVPVLINKYPGCEEFDRNSSVLSADVNDFPSVVSDLINNVDGCYASICRGTQEDILSGQNLEIRRRVEKMFLIRE